MVTCEWCKTASSSSTFVAFTLKDYGVIQWRVCIECVPRVARCMSDCVRKITEDMEQYNGVSGLQTGS